MERMVNPLESYPLYCALVAHSLCLTTNDANHESHNAGVAAAGLLYYLFDDVNNCCCCCYIIFSVVWMKWVTNRFVSFTWRLRRCLFIKMCATPMYSKGVAGTGSQQFLSIHNYFITTSYASTSSNEPREIWLRFRSSIIPHRTSRFQRTVACWKQDVAETQGQQIPHLHKGRNVYQ